MNTGKSTLRNRGKLWGLIATSIFSLTLAHADGPIISNVHYEVGKYYGMDAVYLWWDTNVPADSQSSYLTFYNGWLNTPLKPQMAYHHGDIIPATIVQRWASGSYIVKSRDAQGHLTESGVQTYWEVPLVNKPPFVDAGPDQSISSDHARLQGSVFDEIIPNPSFSWSWSLESGPGDVAFANAQDVETNVAFSGNGHYVLKLTATDQISTVSDTVNFDVNYPPEENRRPLVNAGADQMINNYRDAVTLTGSATDDGEPAVPGKLTYTWIQLEGPGVATFADPHSARTTVTFSFPGTYRLMLDANDGQLSGTDDLLIRSNSYPVVNAGEDQKINMPGAAVLNGTATDDGLPLPPTLTVTWSKLSGPLSGSVTFDDPHSAATSVHFTVGGTYWLKLTASDGLVSSEDTVMISANAPPSVDAGPDQTGFPNDRLNLNGTVTDDGFPSPPGAVTTTWTQVSGPAAVSFTNANAVDTAASFPVVGTYQLRLTADDGAATASDDTTVTIKSMIDAGPDLSIIYPTNASLHATAAGRISNVGWYKTSGPGSVSWANSQALDTTATFSMEGTYMLEIRGWDPVGNRLVTDNVAVTVSPNKAPVVNAGPDRNVTYPTTVQLEGTATDDGIPGPLTITWTKISGPGRVTIRNANSLSTLIDSDNAGVYVLRLTATDGLLTTTDDVEVTFSSPNNRAPQITASPAVQTVAFNSPAVIAYTVADDGIPVVPGKPSWSWSKQDGPGNVVFFDPTEGQTQATFSAAGNYVLQLMGYDGELTSYKNVTVEVLPPAPTVNAGPDQSITLPQQANLNGQATNASSQYWSKVNGPGEITFGDYYALQTTARFTTPGTYTIRLAATNRTGTATDDVTVTVEPQGPIPPANQPPVVNAGPAIRTHRDEWTQLQGSVTDDGLPNPPGVVTAHWRQNDGPAQTIFENADDPRTRAKFPVGGRYTLFLTGNDSQLVNNAMLVVDVELPPPAPVDNQPPHVYGSQPVIATVHQLEMISGYAQDDGLPNPPARVTCTWAKQSGPGNVTLTDPQSGEFQKISATFSEIGNYVLRLTCTDSDLSASADTNVTVRDINHAPRIYAGADKTITLGDPLQFSDSTAEDDGLPNPPGRMALRWIQTVGTQKATISDPTVLHPSITNLTTGEYHFRLYATDLDTDPTNSATMDEVFVIVNPAAHTNQPPVVTLATHEQTVELPAQAYLVVKDVTDDGFPNPPHQVSWVGWSVVMGDASKVQFSEDGKNASFTEPGVYKLRATYTDGALTGSDDIIVTVVAAPTPKTNSAPIVDAGPDQHLPGPGYATLAGTVTDDGLPNGQLTYEWSFISGPTPVQFTDSHLLNTSVYLGREGLYRLRLSASDGSLQGQDDVEISVGRAGAGGPKEIRAPGGGKTLFAPGDAPKISYELRQPSNVHIRIYNSDGVMISEVRGDRPSGPNTEQLDRSAYSSGVYVATMDLGDGSPVTKKKFVIVN